MMMNGLELLNRTKLINEEFNEEVDGYSSFELSVFNADKPPIDKMILLQRIAQFAGRFSSIEYE